MPFRTLALKSSRGCKIRIVNQRSSRPCHRWGMWWRCISVTVGGRSTTLAHKWPSLMVHRSDTNADVKINFHFLFLSQITKADFPELLEQHKRPLYILLLLVFISSCAVLARPGWPKSPYTPEWNAFKNCIVPLHSLGDFRMICMVVEWGLVWYSECFLQILKL